MYAEWANCKRCHLSSHRQQVVLPDGPAESPLWLVGEAPGASEDAAGVPFVGPSGRVLDHLLSQIGIERGCLYLTNMVKCKPVGTTPEAADLAACRFWIEQEVEAARKSTTINGETRVVVLLGRVASALAFPSMSMAQSNGKLRFDGEVIWLSTYHPAALLPFRSPDLIPKVAGHLLLASSLAKAGEPCGAVSSK